ncbi:Translocation protein SEC62 like protein [Argiope bruennichi]|uniref:Translocation protein SEC62 n=1 Tax=Argiope bruennichi TaxID=94029 RepID=A0A8T0F7Y2_ARGBR|nr:Translocation protein SEC62 like protein [Argiope bruennichi]
MAERRKNKKKKEADAKDVDEKPSKEEYAVARYLKQKLPEKKTTLLGHKVEYFIACKAVDLLMESPWAKENKKGEMNFSNRTVAIDFMAKLLDHKFFHRAKKIIVQKEPKKKKKDTEETGQESGKEKESKKSKGKSEKSEATEKSESKKESAEVAEKKKEKKKIKLDMHLDQLFIDSNEPYVWIYDPIPLRTWITGTLMVIAAVLLCLFPLWPQTIRHYIYYLSVAAAFFLIFIIGLAVLRLIVFVVLWILTLGKHHLWLLPNLTEDVGFFESFWPLYKYEYKGSTSDKKSSDKKSQKDDEDQETKEKSDEKEEESKDESAGEDKEVNEQSDGEQRRSEDEAQKTENGFEFLEAEEVSEEEEEDRKTK